MKHNIKVSQSLYKLYLAWLGDSWEGETVSYPKDIYKHIVEKNNV